jgi:dTDP-L-rhamnose 4-epimerase
MRRIVIFGGAGFIGKTYCRLFAGEFDQITVIDRFSGPAHPRPDAHAQFTRDVPADRVMTIVADAACADSFGSILAEADAVLLLHADTGTASSYSAPATCVRENISALLATAEAIRKFSRKGTRVLFTSSRAVYGEGAWSCNEHGRVALSRTQAALQEGRFEPVCAHCGKPLQLDGTAENDREIPLSVYGATKRAGEDLLRTVLVPDGFDLRIVRYQNVFGPGQEISNPYTGVLNWFSAQLRRNANVEIYERGHIRRDFIFVEDAARLLHQLLLTPVSDGPLVVNGGSGRGVKLGEVAQLLKAEYRSTSQIVDCDKFRIGDVLGARADMTRAKSVLGFECSISLQEGLARYAKWFEGESQP